MKPFLGLRLLFFLFPFFIPFAAFAQTVTLTAGQEDYVTSADITADEDGIISALSGTDGDLNTIQNNHIITTGDEGAFSSAYGIRVTGAYNAVTNSVGATIQTTGSSGRGISITDNSTATNAGTITTSGSTAHGMYAGGDNNVLSNSGVITTAASSGHGMYANGDSNVLTNSGSITTAYGYGVFLNGNDNDFTNSGSITTTVGSSAYGIYISAGADMFATSSYYSTVINDGNITSNDHGIYARDDYVNISNTGTITTADDSSIYGVVLEGNNATFTNSGTINATTYAIHNSGSGAVINNLGTLNAGVYIGDGVLNILGGTISGEINGDSALGSVVIGSTTYSGITFNQEADFVDLATLTISSSSTLNANHAISAANIIISDGSTLNLNQGASVTGTIRGESDGVGRLNILGNFSFSDDIGALGHALEVVNIAADAVLTTTGNMYASDVSVSGRLDLSSGEAITIAGNVSGTGTAMIKLGSNNHTISGNLTLTSGDTLSLNFDGTNIGHFDVASDARIDANANLAITTNASQGYVENGSQFSIVTGGSGSDIAAIADDNINVNGSGSNISGLLQYSTRVDDNRLLLDVSRLGASQVTANINARNIYDNINSIGGASSAELLSAQLHLDGLNAGSSEVNDALVQLLPQSSKANLDVTRNLANALAQTVMSGFAHRQKEAKNSAWAQIFGRAVTQDQTVADEGYNANTIGMIFARQKQILDSTNIGGSFSYARSDVKSSDGFKSNVIDSLQLNLYAAFEKQQYFANILAGFAWNQFSSNRAIAVSESNATARFSGQTYIARLQAGMQKTLRNNLSVKPHIALNLAHNNVDAYSEKGAGTLNLDVGGVSAQFLEIRIGSKLDWQGKITLPEFEDFSHISLSSNLSYGQDIIADQALTTSNFQGHTQSFNTKVVDVDTRNIQLDLNAAIYYLEDSILSLNYRLDRSQTSQSHLLSLRAKLAF